MRLLDWLDEGANALDTPDPAAVAARRVDRVPPDPPGWIDYTQQGAPATAPGPRPTSRGLLRRLWAEVLR